MDDNGTKLEKEKNIAPVRAKNAQICTLAAGLRPDPVGELTGLPRSLEEKRGEEKRKGRQKEWMGR